MNLSRRRDAIAAGAALAVAVALFVSCGGCGRSGRGGPSAAQPTSSSPAEKSAADGGVARDEHVWELAQQGDDEDLATLAVHEGAAGLVEGAGDPALRMTAIRAMAFARGWAQMPFLAGVAATGDDAQAGAALDAILQLAARPRTAEDPEDAPELAEGCGKLLDLAKAAAKPRPRRVRAIRALRMMPCPKMDVPTDLDAR